MLFREFSLQSRIINRAATNVLAIYVLDQVIRKNTTVLCKASRGMAMEELVEYIKEIRPEG